MRGKQPRLKDVDITLKNLKMIQREKKTLDKHKINEIRKNLDGDFDSAREGQKKLKQDHQELFEKTKIEVKKKTPAKSNCSSNGKLVNKGIDDSKSKPFEEDETEYLDNIINDIKLVNKLDFDCLRYLVCQVFLEDLKNIKAGKLKSKIHNEYTKKAKSKSELLSDMRTDLFTNDQIDYVNGLLQGVFSATEKDNKGDIKHSEIGYILVVMFTEITKRIVKHVHKFKTLKQAEDFIIQSADDSTTE